MAFTSWADELARFKNAIANQDEETLLKSGWTSSTGQSVTFKKWEDVEKRLKFLQNEANSEANTAGRRSSPFSIGFKSGL